MLSLLVEQYIAFRSFLFAHFLVYDQGYHREIQILVEKIFQLRKKRDIPLPHSRILAACTVDSE